MDRTPDYVTQRNMYRSNSLKDLSLSSPVLNNSLLSLPNTSVDDIQTFVISFEEVEALKSNLMTAEHEIENLNLENQALKNELEKCNKLLTTYKTFNFTNITPMTPISSRKRKKVKNTRGNTPLNKTIDNNRRHLRLNNDLNMNLKSHAALVFTRKERGDPEENITLQEQCTSEPSVEFNVEPSKEVNIGNATIEEQSEYVKVKVNVELREETLLGTKIAQTQTSPVIGPKKNAFPRVKPNRIFIFGGKQCVGAASKLSEMRRQKRQSQESYEVVSFLKPDASSEEILNTCILFDITCEDRIVLSVGENDRNPTRINIELSAALKTLPKCPIFVLSVGLNRYLNEFKLNQMLQLLCQQFDNCTFVKVNNSYKGAHRVRILCQELNIVLNQYDYDHKYLSYKVKKIEQAHITHADLHTHRVLKDTIPKPGTMPFYFSRVTKTRQTPEDLNPSNTKEPVSMKGTIPFYFKRVAYNNTNKLFRDSTKKM